MAMIGIIGGTGLADDLAARMTNLSRRAVSTPFGRPSGPIITGRLGRYSVAFLNRHGPGHRLSPSAIPFAANIYALKGLGVRAIVATGAVGSLRAQIKPGGLVASDQFIDKTYRRLNTFFEGYGAVHCEFAYPVCQRLHRQLLQAAKAARIKVVPTGTYVCMEGPQFSTRAESMMHRAWGGDLIGMTAMPEARLAREAQICYCLVCMVSDYDCWRSRVDGRPGHVVTDQILANIRTASDRGVRLICELLERGPDLADESCPCRHSLDLAVWTDKRHLVRGKAACKYAVLFE